MPNIHLSRLALGRLFIVSAVALISGCASAPKDVSSVVDSLRRFLLEMNAPFEYRAGLLGIQGRLDLAKMSIDDNTRLEVVPGSPLRYARITLFRKAPRMYFATMTTIFDTALVCVRDKDLSVLGKISPGPVVVDHRVINGELLVAGLVPTPLRIELASDNGPIHISLVNHEKGCLSELTYNIQIAVV